MEKLIKKLDEIFDKYSVAEEDIAEVGELIASIGGELNTEGEEFDAPEMENGSDEDEEGFED
jgi:hypothetical protein